MDDCLRFERGDGDLGGSGRITAEDIGLWEVLAGELIINGYQPTQNSPPF